MFIATETGRVRAIAAKLSSPRFLNGTLATIYDPRTARFVQPDPIGYESGMNLYGYVSGDPINLVDPFGLRGVCWNQDASYTTEGETVVQSRRICVDVPGDGGFGPTTYFDGPFGGGGGGGGTQQPPVDRCAPRASLARSGRSFEVNLGQLQSIAQRKFMQHSWPLDRDGFQQSTFGGVITDGGQLATRALMLITSRDATPGGGLLNLRIIGDVGATVGRDARSSSPTTSFLTVVLGPELYVPGRALPLRPVVSIYPGCP